MQEFLEEGHSIILRLLQPILLQLVILVASRGKPMRKSREVDVLIRYTNRGDLLITILFQFRREDGVRLGSQNLHRHLNSIDLLFRQQRRVGGGYGIDERRISSELKDSPTKLVNALLAIRWD